MMYETYSQIAQKKYVCMSACVCVCVAQTRILSAFCCSLTQSFLIAE